MLPDPESRKRRAVWILALLAGIVAADHATKLIAITTLKDQPPLVFLGDLFRLQYAENTGAFLGLGGNMSEAARFWVLTLANSVILVGVAGYLFLARAMPFPVVLALSLILAGGVGNLIDRIFRDGRVVDFMNMGINFETWQLRTGIFNIADIAIMGGLFVLIGYELLFAPKPAPPADSDSDA